MTERIVFSTSIYRLDAVELAAKAYDALASFSVQAVDDDIIVEIRDIHPNFHEKAARLLDAFCNHVLFETIVLERKDNGGDI